MPSVNRALPPARTRLEAKEQNGQDAKKMLWGAFLHTTDRKSLLALRGVGGI
jgi:hypothetical protein